jgi:hypothetical protein
MTVGTLEVVQKVIQVRAARLGRGSGGRFGAGGVDGVDDLSGAHVEREKGRRLGADKEPGRIGIRSKVDRRRLE